MDYTITGNFILPSLGKVYTPEIDPAVTLRTMTTTEEMRRMSSSDYPYRIMSEIIQDCIVSGPEISPYDMVIADYLFLLHKLRIVTYGSEYKLTTMCPYCTHANNDTVDLNDLIVQEFDPIILDKFTFELPQTKKKITLKFQTPRMLDQVAAEVKNYQKKSKNSLNPEIIYSIVYMIKEIDGRIVNQLDVENWVKELPMMDVQYILAYADKLNNCFGIDKRLDVECDVCKLPYVTAFRLTNEFFRPEVDLGW